MIHLSAHPKILASTALLGWAVSWAVISSAAPAAALDFDRVRWAGLLETHTRAVTDTAGTRVDYAALARDPAWRSFVDDLARRSPPLSRSGRMAFWIDTYNVFAIDMVVRHWPVDSIRDVGSFFTPVWKIDAGAVDGRRVTLHEIEHEILRPMGDPRIHMAIVCASTSCPSLAREPFEPSELDARLDAAVGRFLDDPRKGLRVDRPENEIWLSRIFDWFEDDFEAAGGVTGFIVQHLKDTHELAEADRAWLRASPKDAPARFFEYDWRVNAVAR